MIRARRGYFSIAVLILAAICAISLDAMQAPERDNAQVVRKVPTTHKIVALTIDDGPHYKTTPLILDILKEKDVKATFFVLGKNAEKNLKLIAREVAEGHEIASHGYSHKKFNKMSEKDIQEEIEKTEKILLGVPVKPEFFRPPYGSYNKKMVSAVREKGYMTILWSVDSNDWRHLSVDKMVKNVVESVSPGKIILVHDGQYPLPTIAALPVIIDRLRVDGYEFVTISELLRYYEIRR
jgi:peptidoglycan/xylan/chitin deacetylase (PgdA/CDA1 family)